MSTGMGINILNSAYVKNPSTVEEMESTSAPYHKLCLLSNFYRRVPIKGQTVEGFARVFLPAYLRLEGYIDRFGKSVVGTPTERQKKLSPLSLFALSNKGARETMQAERDALLAENTPESMEAYRSLHRKSPFTWAECWLGSAGNGGYNLEIIDRRLAEISKMRSFDKPPYRLGYFYPENGKLGDRVIWQDDSEHSKFKLSMWLPPELTNQREAIEIWDGLSQRAVPSWRPLNGQRFTLGCDPYRNLKAMDVKQASKVDGRMSNSRQSDGGIAVLWEYDATVDAGKQRKEWDSFRCVCTYRNRPATQEEYFFDIFYCAQWFGAMIYPEQNVDAFLAFLFDNGFGGYALYDIDLTTGKRKPLPGRYNSTETNQDMMREIKDYVEFRGHVECHDDLLAEIKSCRGVEDFTRLDLKTAFGMALLGSKSRYREFLDNSNVESVPIDGLF
jgi:hypothetical protein